MKEEITIYTKGSLTIPSNILNRMGVRAGDRLRYSVKGKKLEIEKISDAEALDPFSAFDEWSSEADEKAFAHLNPKNS